MADVDLDALEARLRNHVCGRCDNGMTTAPCRGCEAVARQANERARRGISSTVGIGHRGACTATPITCRMCEGTGKRLPMDGETMLALIARVREAERERDTAIEQRDAARAEVAAMAELHALRAERDTRNAIEPGRTDMATLPCSICGHDPARRAICSRCRPGHCVGCLRRDLDAARAEVERLREVRVAAERLHPTDIAPRYRCECEGDRRCDECALRGAL